MIQGRSQVGIGAPGGRKVVVNDVHSELNATAVARVHRPESAGQLVNTIKRAAAGGLKASICGGRHAMGGQGFVENGVLIDMGSLAGVLSFDREAGRITVEAGISWPGLLGELREWQEPRFEWTFAQKQTGADDLSIGGAVSANIHGRGLNLKPFIRDIESFELITADGVPRHCSRKENAELFRLAVGGYGLFGIVYAVTLRLGRRHKLRRVVRMGSVSTLMRDFDRRRREGFTYGDFQFAIDPDSDEFLDSGVFSCYQPVPESTPIPEDKKSLSPAEWERLLHLAHVDKSRGFREYAGYYQSTDGQVYWSDEHQLSHYPAGYHRGLDEKMGAPCRRTEMITELYVPREALAVFMGQVRARARRFGWNIIYGTIRLIERDDESFLAWAREPWACVVFNICVEHSGAGLARAKERFRSLIVMAISHGGSFYLTYHNWAAPEQVRACYPQIGRFFGAKRRFDPRELFSSNWYRHYQASLSAD